MTADPIGCHATESAGALAALAAPSALQAWDVSGAISADLPQLAGATRLTLLYLACCNIGSADLRDGQVGL